MFPPMLVPVLLTISTLSIHLCKRTLDASSVLHLEHATDRNDTPVSTVDLPELAQGEIVVNGVTYHWGAKLGSGAFGVVQVLEDEDGRKFAGKIVRNVTARSGADPEVISQYKNVASVGGVQKEVDLQRRCKGEQIVEILGDRTFVDQEGLEGGWQGGDTVIVMERLLCDLRMLMSFGKGLTQGFNVRDIFEQIVRGVKHMHDKGVAHRDLKPANIFLLHGPETSSGKRRATAKIGDFGLAAEIGNLRDDSGSPSRMSPEAILSLPLADGAKSFELHGRRQGDSYSGREADVWSLGVMLYEMMTGRLPWPAPSLQKASLTAAEIKEWEAQKLQRNYANILKNNPSYNGLAGKAKELIEGMLQKDAKKRWTIDQVLMALRDPASGQKRSVGQMESLEMVKRVRVAAAENHATLPVSANSPSPSKDSVVKIPDGVSQGGSAPAGLMPSHLRGAPIAN